MIFLPSFLQIIYIFNFSMTLVELPSRVGANSSLLRAPKGIPTRSPAVVGSLHSLSHISTQRSGQLAANGDGASKLTKSRSIANLNGKVVMHDIVPQWIRDFVICSPHLKLARHNSSE
jgi:hypothetical protein